MTARATAWLAVLLAAGCDSIFGLDHVPPYQPADASIDAPIEVGWKAVAAGYNHSCGIHADDTLWCWGGNDNNAIGIGSSAGTIGAPVRVGGDLFAQVSSRYDHTCAVTLDGALYCWGYNGYGQLGTGNDLEGPVPQRIDGTWKQVSAGGYHTCAIRNDDTLWCWGYNYYGEVGTGVAQVPQPVPVQIGTETWLDVDAGWFHSCAVRTDHSLWCWGDNDFGAFGDTSFKSSPSPVVSPGEEWSDVTTGVYTTCGRTLAGALRCWGTGTSGELGNGTHDQTPSPQPVATDGVEAEDWIQISMDYLHVCGVRAGGSLWCWGDDGQAQLGVELPAPDSPTPLRITQGSTLWRRVATGAGHTCAIDIDNRMWCFGAAGRAQLGTPDQLHPLPVQVPDSYDMISATANVTCGLQTGTALPACAGYNGDGQLGDGTHVNRQVMTPVLTSATGWTQIGAGAGHSCGGTTSEAYCWGDNAHGALGDGTLDSRPTPSQIVGWTNPTVSSDHTCGLSGSYLFCWGWNNQGQLGNGSAVDSAAAAYIAYGIVQVTTGYQHTCAINNVGGIACWGRNSEGELGIGSTTNAYGPAPLDTTATGPMLQVDAGTLHTCGVATDHKLWCWGSNASGQLGTGNRAYAQVPVRVGTRTWSSVAAGDSHTCAIAMDGTLWCWGRNARGQLGLGTFVDRFVPAQVGTDTDWVSIDAGYEHNCARKAGGATWCWGGNDYGEIPDGTAWRATPVPVGS